MDKLLEMLLAIGVREFMGWVAATGGWAVAFPVLLEMLKRWDRFKWLDEWTSTLNRVVAVVAGSAAAIGISYTFDGAAGTLVVQGVTFAALAKLIVNIASQLGLQEVFYRLVLKR
jgi:hypothetical protein